MRIEDDVRDTGWAVGTNLGSESELLARYGVSRAVLREAMSLTEFLGVAKMRRGPGGGLYVTKPHPSAVVAAVSVYFAYRAVRLEDIIGARRPVEDLAARLAAERRTSDDLDRFAERMRLERNETRTDHWVLHDLIARASGNPAVELLIDILGQITNLYVPAEPPKRSQKERSAEVAVAHRALLDAIRAGNGDVAARRMQKHLDAIQAALGNRRLNRTIVFGDNYVEANGRKLATSVAQRLLADIVEMGWPAGEMLGSEPELTDRYEVSRAVLREANRLLEFQGIIRTQRGVGGGIFVSTPNEAATTDALAVYLDSRGVTVQQLFEVREAIELANVELAASRLDKQAIGLLAETLAEEMAAPVTAIGTSGHILHLRIAELTGNHAIELFLHALTRLTQHHQFTPLEGFPLSYEDAASSVSQAHAAIVKAIAAGDADTAVRRMRRHLRAVPPLLR
jgi:DNA-binding FadR family transcriptional regulator